jgi:thermitase
MLMLKKLRTLFAAVGGRARVALTLCLVLALQLARVGTQAPEGRQIVRTESGAEAAAGEALVQFRDPATAALQREPLADYVDAVPSTVVGERALHRFRSRTFTVDQLVSFLRSQPDVVYAEPNYVLRAVATPNDPYFPLLWGLFNSGQTIGGSVGIPGADISAPEAWDVTTGSRNVVVGVIDTGIAHGHPDLIGNIWSAPAAFNVVIGGLQLTCPAGSHGFNAITNACDPQDDHYHGTHVAGTIGATGNNGIGVAGVNWTTSLIGAKFLAANGSGYLDDAVETIEFLVQTKAAFAQTNGANVRVLNNSWGGGGYSQTLNDTIALAGANDMLFVAAAGNNGTNNDALPFYPASYQLPNVLAVAATDNRDQLAGFSNRGVNSVHLAAPGVNTASTMPGGGYSYLSGTSMAAPHVSGAAALVLSRCSMATGALRQNLLSTVDAVGALVGQVSTGGRPTVARAGRACAGPAAPTGLTAIAGDARVSLTWNAVSGATSYRVKRAGVSGGPYTTIATGLSTTSYTDTPLINGATYFYVVSAVNTAGEGPNSTQVFATPNASNVTKPLPPPTLTAKPGDAKVTLTWPASAGATSYNVKRAPVSAGPFVTIASVTTPTFVNLNLANGTTYFYLVTAVNQAGESAASPKASAMPAPVPLPPAGFTVTAGASAGVVNFTWNASAWATLYTVELSTINGGPYSSARKTTTTSLTITGLPSGRLYYFVGKAHNASGGSAPTTQVSIVVP